MTKKQLNLYAYIKSMYHLKTMYSRFFYCLFFTSVIIGACRKESRPKDPTDDSLKDGLIAYYPFSGNTNDESGNNYHLVNNGASLYQDRYGNSNSAYYFNGIDENMSIPKITKSDSLVDFTISLWINSEDSSATFLDLKVDEGQALSHNMGLFYNGGYFYSSAFIGECQVVSPYSSFCNGYAHTQLLDSQTKKWSHIVFCKTADSIYLFNNGRRNTYSTKLGKKVIVSFSSGGNVGSIFNPWGLHGFYKGAIDDIRIYNRALTEEEIQQLFEDKP
jgi:hypothetical protein